MNPSACNLGTSLGSLVVTVSFTPLGKSSVVVDQPRIPLSSRACARTMRLMARSVRPSPETKISTSRKAGQTVANDRRQPLELQRQVQIGAGTLVLAAPFLDFWSRRGFLRFRCSSERG